MLIINNNIVCSKTKICNTIFSKFKGLMFTKKDDQLALIFPLNNTKQPFHMAFVFYEIDLILRNKNKEIIEIKKNFKPFTTYQPKLKAEYAIEITPKKRYKLGDKVSFDQY